MLEKVKNNSGILTWNEDNINKVPSGAGVYILRNSPINGFIIEIDHAGNLKEKLIDVFRTRGMNGPVNFFSWYETENSEDAKELLEELKLKYLIESNLG